MGKVRNGINKESYWDSESLQFTKRGQRTSYDPSRGRSVTSPDPLGPDTYAVWVPQ